MNIKLKPLAEQVMVITGASSGIGLTAARAAAKAGAAVFLVARNAAVLAEACEGIRAEGGRADYAVADVGDETQVAAAAEAAVARFGRIDTWVNNAGVAIYSKVEDTPLDEHRRMFQTNYWGVVNGTVEALKRLRPRGGALITVGSIASDCGTPILGTYAATKHAVKGYLDSLRIELIHDEVPISVSLIKPSGIATPLNEHAANHLEGEAKIPPPTYAPDLVADAILRAAQHPIREVTVGGAGEAQVLLATHLPAVYDRVAGLAIGQMHDPAIPKTTGSNLFGPMSEGRARARDANPREFSVFTSARLNPLATAGVGLGLGLLSWTVRGAMRRR